MFSLDKNILCSNVCRQQLYFRKCFPTSTSVFIWFILGYWIFKIDTKHTNNISNCLIRNYLMNIFVSNQVACLFGDHVSDLEIFIVEFQYPRISIGCRNGFFYYVKFELSNMHTFQHYSSVIHHFLHYNTISIRFMCTLM